MSIFSLIPDLINGAKQRAIARKVRAINLESKHQEYILGGKQSAIQQQNETKAYQRAVASSRADIAARGMGRSSVMATNTNDMQEREGQVQTGFGLQRTRAAQQWSDTQKLDHLAGQSAKANALWGTIGQVADAVGSVAMMAFSDKDKKENIKPAGKAIDIVIATPVKEWNYKEDPVNKHLGPMAQDVQKNAGDKVAPEGKQIDLVSMNGMLMKAVQDLAAEVAELKKTRK